MSKYLIFSTLLLLISSIEAANPQAVYELKRTYEIYVREPSDTRAHIPVLRRLSAECSSAVEIGVRSIVTTWGILQGLSESSASSRSYTGIDLVHPPEEAFQRAKTLSEGSGVSFHFIVGNDMEIDIEPTDLLFIDSLHTYCHLTYELEKFSPKTRKYIAMHDTSVDWENRDDTQYTGDYSEYPADFDRTKRGLWPAVVDFLARHPEWVLSERFYTDYGFTILKRVSE